MPSYVVPVRYRTWYSSAAPNANYHTRTGYLAVGNNPGSEAALYFTNPFPAPIPGEVRAIESATLTLRTRALPAGTHTLTVQLLGQGVGFNRVTWTTRPTAVLGAPVTLTKTGAQAANASWVFDVAAMLATVAAGGPFYGIRITSGSAGPIMVQGNMSPALDPVLAVAWTNSTPIPRGLTPSAALGVSNARPVLQWEQPSGSRLTGPLQGVQVQTSATTSFTAPAWDSGTVASSTPSLDLATASFPARAANQVTYWRARQQVGGKWSDWSTPTSWTHRPLPAVNLLAPTGTVADPTPSYSWTYSSPSGSPQGGWRTGLYDVTGGGRRLHDYSGDQVGTATAWAPTKATTPGRQYEAVVDVWDSHARAAVSGASTYASSAKTFTHTPSASVAPVTGLVVRVQYPTPAVQLTFTRTELADAYIIRRDGVEVARGPGSEFGVHPAYAWTDPVVATGVHTWTVHAVQNHVSSQAATVTATAEHIGTWLWSERAGYVCLQNDTDHALTMTENVAVHRPEGTPVPVVVTQALRGWEDTLTGLLVDVKGMPAGQSAETWRDNLMAIKSEQWHPVRIAVGRQAFGAVVHNVQLDDDPTPRGGYRAAWTFYQVDGFAFDVSALASP